LIPASNIQPDQKTKGRDGEGGMRGRDEREGLERERLERKGLKDFFA
jgi:hypothetical protein